MLSNSDVAKCHLCSRLSSVLRGLLFRFAGRLCCAWINRKTNAEGNDTRVRDINSCAPECACEKHRMSKHSPGVVVGNERLSRFIFSPMHIKRGKVVSSLFSHAANKGCSVQRESRATNSEIEEFVSGFMNRIEDAVWLGVVQANCEEIRGLRIDNDESQTVCVYDTAEKDNSSHAEMCASHTFTDEDDIELRAKLMEVFGAKRVHSPPESYRDAVVWRNLRAELRERKLPRK